MSDIPAPYCMANDSVIMSLFILNIIGMSYVLMLNGANIFETLKGHFYYNRSTAPFNDRTHIARICNLLMYMQTIFYAGIVAMPFLTHGMQPAGKEESQLLMGAIMLTTGAALLLKRIAYYIINNILFTAKETTEWKELFLFTIKLTGFALTPAATTILFLPASYTSFVHYYIILILLAYICIIINSLTKIIFTKKRNYLDIFLYLCALEFLPLAMVWKFLEQLSDFIIIKN